MTLQLSKDIERHERCIYGGNGEGVGLLGRMKMLEDFVGELRVERREAAADRRKILVTVISAAIVNIMLFLAGLLITHPDIVQAASSP